MTATDNERELARAADHVLEPCSCCGGVTRTVSGTTSVAGSGECAYFVRWTVGEVARHGADLTLVLGRWGDGTTAQDRVAVSFVYRVTPEGSGFMVIDASSSPIQADRLASRGLPRDEVVATPLAVQAYAILDTIWLHDERVSELAEHAA